MRTDDVSDDDGNADGGTGDTPAKDKGTAPQASSSCRAEASKLDCTACCDGASPAARRELNLLEACLCESPGKCADVCADTFCAGRVTEPKSPCSDCLTASLGTCAQTAATNCSKSASCAPVAACYKAAACSGKPA